MCFAATMRLLLILMVFAGCASAALLPFRSRERNSSTISLRKRLHVNTLITEPGTAELDSGYLYSFSSGSYSIPTAFKFTPRGRSTIWGRTEYSFAFDSLAGSDVGGERSTQFGQTLTFTATSVIHDGEKFDVAIAPQAVVFLRDESGVRLGAIAIARYDSGRNSTGVTASWSAATHSSPNNPAGVFDLGLGYGRQLSGSAWMEKFTPHANFVFEKATANARSFSFFEGVEYQVTQRFALDLSGQHFAVNTSSPDHQIVLSMTLNFGHAN